jgi:ribosomal-protein-alanine N-acetyltransferase
MSDFDFSAFPTLTTSRLVLRQPKPGDADDIFVFRSDPEVQKYNGVPMTDIAEYQHMLQFSRDQFAAREGLLWAVVLREEQKVVGLVGFSYDSYHARASLGYDIAREYWGRGIASEALEAVLRFGFEQLALNRIEAETIVDNLPSVRVLEKLGFEREGVRKAYSLEDDGLYHDDAIYALLRSQYSPA